MESTQILENCLVAAKLHPIQQNIPADASQKVEMICRCLKNKAPIRFLMACLLAKTARPEVDIRKPYTEIGGADSFSGRVYDERFVEPFVAKYGLPCNSTTAFLTPAFRNIDRLLTKDLVLVGNPREVYAAALELLDKVQNGAIGPEPTLREIIRFLLQIKHEQDARMQQLLADLRQPSDAQPLSSEQIAVLMQQHLACKNSSRLPVLMLSAVYASVGNLIGEAAVPLRAHNAADKQTGALGDVEVVFLGEGRLATCYEMKDKRVTINDINLALSKVATANRRVDNYVFITTEPIEQEVLAFAASLYDKTGVEFAVLDCMGFVRHFLHFFHRHRQQFLEAYQTLLLEEPASAVGQPLKEAFLALRKAAESN